MSKRVVITSHDGSYLVGFLLARGCKVLGIVRRSDVKNCDCISHLLEQHP
jgi:GDP-D-mannose dehydratase